jgi:lipoyl(octanoyl) transferase
MQLPEWRVEPGLIDYPSAVAAMEARVEAIRAGTAGELIWLVEHPPVYTAGTSAKPSDLVDPGRFPVHAVGRGGQYTYHGPGQRVAYVMLDLAARGRDVRCFVDAVERWIVDTLRDFDIAGRAVPGRVGVWVDTPAGEAKIAAIGVRVRRWVTFHGLAINVAPDLSHFGGIVPCGLPDYPVTSLAALGRAASLADLDAALAVRLPLFLDSLGGCRAS